jgi:acyl-coenzyme A synthetase/AMP-(fatty) acid ligase
MSWALLDPSRPWLVGGGLTGVWTYGRLFECMASPEDPAGTSDSVAAVLVTLTRALVRNEVVDLGELRFSGEGAPFDTPAEGDPVATGVPFPNPLEHSRAELILRSSGSTGGPRAVRHRLGALLRGISVRAEHRQAVWGLAYNPTHIAGVQVYLQALANGNLLVNLWGLGRAEVVERCAAFKVTHLSATPTFYRLLLPVDRPLPALRSITVGGERSDPSLLQRLREQFPAAKVRNIYASTEAGSLFAAEGDEFTVGSAQADLVRCTDGRLWLHRSLLGEFAGDGGRDSISDIRNSISQPNRNKAGLQERTERTEDGGQTTEDGRKEAQKAQELEGRGQAAEEGELKTDGRGRRTEGSQRGVKGSSSARAGFAPDAADWYDTGDVVEVTGGQPLRFRIVGRAQGWINVGGEKVNPVEVEAVLTEHPGIALARVYGKRNSVTGQLVAADLVAREPAPSLEEVRRHLVGRLPPFKVPRIVRFVEVLELTRSGKVVRHD